MNDELFSALADLEKEKGIPKDYMLDKIRQALTAAYHRENPEAGDNIEFAIDPDMTVMRMYARKTVVEKVGNPAAEIDIEEAKKEGTPCRLSEIL